MANITGFIESPDNPEWVSLTMDDGSQSPFAHDPTGEFRQQSTEIARKIRGEAPNPMAGALASNAPAPTANLATDAGGALASNPLAMPAPGPPAAIVAPSPAVTGIVSDPRALGPGDQASLRGQDKSLRDELSFGLNRQRADEAKAAEARANQAQPGAQPYRLVDTGASGPQVTKTHTEQSSGYTPEDKKRIDAANLAAIDAQTAADNASLQARTEQVNAEWNRLSDAEKIKLAEKAETEAKERDFTTKVDAQTKRLEDISARPIDPSQAFAGDAGWYAFMAGFGDSLQNFGAALAGRGPVANPGATMDRMIERSVAMQTQQKEADFKAGRITADQLNADREEVRLRLSTVGKQLAETQLAKAKTEEENLGLRAMSDKFEADRKAAIAKAAVATARTQQVSDSRQTAPGAPGGVSMFLGEKPDWEAVKAHNEKQAGAEQVERGVSRLEKAAGWTWDERANNGAGGYIGADGKPVTSTGADVAGVSVLGARFKTGEGARELDGALQDMAAGGAKVKDPVGAVSDKSIEAEQSAMAANTDEGILRAAERTRRNLRGMRASVDAGYSPGVVNASRYRRSAETEFRGNQPGLPRSRPATPEDLRK